jgi:hypothetical protein
MREQQKKKKKKYDLNKKVKTHKFIGFTTLQRNIG